MVLKGCIKYIFHSFPLYTKYKCSESNEIESKFWQALKQSVVVTILTPPYCYYHPSASFFSSPLFHPYFVSLPISFSIFYFPTFFLHFTMPVIVLERFKCFCNNRISKETVLQRLNFLSVSTHSHVLLRKRFIEKAQKLL